MPAGSLTLIAGNSRAGFSGDGGPAVNAQLNTPQGIALDSAGNIYIADSLNNRVRKVDTKGIITTFAGNGSVNPPGLLGRHRARHRREPASADGARRGFLRQSLHRRLQR